jgi:hypothetical protein
LPAPEDVGEVYLCRERVHMRKSINGLSILGEQPLWGQDQDPAVERAGFVLWYKRLEKNRFAWPLSGDEAIMSISGRDLN